MRAAKDSEEAATSIMTNHKIVLISVIVISVCCLLNVSLLDINPSHMHIINFLQVVEGIFNLTAVLCNKKVRTAICLFFKGDQVEVGR